MNTAFSLFSDVHAWVMSGIISSLRLFPAFMMLPFLNQNTVTALVKFPLVFVLGLALWPHRETDLLALEIQPFVMMAVKELLIGLIMAVFLCFPFWVMHAVGSYIDNQRGATLSSSLSPQTGIDSSELANFFNMVSAMIILESGGLLKLLDVLQRSYVLWPPQSDTLPAVAEITTYLSAMISAAVRLSAPVITIFLVAELLLGLLSRYTPQLNAFSMALTVKSLVGFGVLLLYFSPVIPQEVMRLEFLLLPGRQ